MDDESKGVMIMPADLAMEREMAYRKKVKHGFVQVHIVSGSSGIIDMKIAPQTVKLEGDTELNILLVNPVETTSDQPSNMHGDPSTRIVKEPSTTKHSKPRSSKGLLFVCDVCQVICNGELSFRLHSRGRKHTRMLKILETNRDLIIKENWCNDCRVQCMHAAALEQHLAGKKHAACVQALEARSKRARHV